MKKPNAKTLIYKYDINIKKVHCHRDTTLPKQKFQKIYTNNEHNGK